MFNKINLQFLISYTGIIPYVLLLLDKYIFFKLNEEFIANFIIYYSIIIIVFIGAINWDFHKNISNFKIICGFFPSVFAVFVIILNLFNYETAIIFLLIKIFLILQLFFDYFFIFNKNNKNVLYFLRMPLTILICLSLFFI